MEDQGRRSENLQLRAQGVMVESESCETCRFFLASGAICRRFPPQVVVWPADGECESHAETNYPEVYHQSSAWCGEYRAKPSTNIFESLTKHGFTPPHVLETKRAPSPIREMIRSVIAADQARLYTAAILRNAGYPWECRDRGTMLHSPAFAHLAFEVIIDQNPTIGVLHE